MLERRQNYFPVGHGVAKKIIPVSDEGGGGGGGYMFFGRIISSFRILEKIYLKYR